MVQTGKCKILTRGEVFTVHEISYKREATDCAREAGKDTQLLDHLISKEQKHSRMSTRLLNNLNVPAFYL